MAAYILYRLTPREGGKTDKIPCDRDGNAAGAQDPANWLTLTEADTRAGLLGLGVGIVIQAPLFAVDLDACHDGTAWAPYVAGVLAAFPGAYVEVSVSGRGLHVIGSYTGPRPLHGTRCAAIRGELYTGGRFIALGRQHVSGSMETDHTAALQALIAQHFAPRETAESDEWTETAHPGYGIADDVELVRRACRSTSARATFGGGASFADLWEGDPDRLAVAFPPQAAGSAYDGSGADLALCNHLAWWAGGNCEQVARLLRASGLARDKHDREDYMRSTVLRACAGLSSWYSDRAPGVSTSAPVALSGSAAQAADGSSSPATLAPAAAAPFDPTGLAVHVMVLGRSGKYDATLPNLEYVLTQQTGSRIGFDRFRDTIMIDTGDGQWRAVTDNDMVALRARLERVGCFAPISAALMRDALALVASRYSFDSAITWLTSLVWDGVPRVDTFLAQYCGAADDEYSRAVGRYIWTGLANRVLEPGCQLDMVVAFVSPQGRRKSTGLAELAPHPDFFSDSVSFLGDGDDFKRLIRGKVIVEIAELVGLSRAALEHVKALITRRREQWTEKYQVMPTTFDRRCMLFATTNDERFLPPDETGNRRWLPVVVGTLDNAAIARDRAQLWAEGAAIYTATGQAWQDAERLAAGRHDDHEARDVWTDAIARWLADPVVVAGAPAAPPPGLAPFSTGDVAEGALRLTHAQLDARSEKRIARTLRQLGYMPKSIKISGQVLRRWVAGNGW